MIYVKVRTLKCPVTREPCMGEGCAWWCDDWSACALSAAGIYNHVRDAAVDAAVEIINAYGVDGHAKTDVSQDKGSEPPGRHALHREPERV